MDADVCIIQECEKLKEDHFPNSKFFWTGRIENKGLGVLVKMEVLPWILPIIQI